MLQGQRIDIASYIYIIGGADNRAGRKIGRVEVRVKRDSGKCSGWRRDGPINVCCIHPSNKRRSTGVQACYLHGSILLIFNLFEESQALVKLSILYIIQLDTLVNWNTLMNWWYTCMVYLLYIFWIESSKSRDNTKYLSCYETFVKPFSGFTEKGNCQSRICTWTGSY